MTNDSPPAPREPSRFFGIKDVFTTINCTSGVVALCLCVEQRPFAASIAILLGYLLGDALDGPIARWLNTANEFGAEYDAIADHVAHCLAPAAIVYTVYRDAALGLPAVATHGIALGLAALIVVACSIRSARNRVIQVDADGIWAGLPRTLVGFLSMSLANSALVLDGVPLGAWVGVVLIPIWCGLALTWLPFANHRPQRRLFWFVRVAIAAYFLTTIAALVLAPRYVFDVLLGWLTGYLFVSRGALTTAERRAYRQRLDTALAGGPR